MAIRVKFGSSKEKITTRRKNIYLIPDTYGIKLEKISEDELECDLLIGKLQLSISEVKAIIRGVASLEMRGEPFITQSVYFFLHKNQATFNIYDDRGCDIWSNSIEELMPIYENLNDWILNYNRQKLMICLKGRKLHRINKASNEK